jgi:hypothetical protein
VAATRLPKGAPVGVYPARRRAQMSGGQDAADGAGSDVVSESGELALDAAVSAARVVPGQPDDELAQLGTNAWATGRARIGPFLGDQALVPGQEGGGGDESVATQLAGQEPGQGGQNARSGQVGRAGPSCRRSTMTSCRSVNVSAMSVLLRRQSSASQDSIRVMVR